VLVIMLALALVAGMFPRPWLVAVFLGVGVVGAVVYQLSLLASAPFLVDDAFFLLNRPAVSLVLVAVGSTTWLSGLVWILIGFLASTGASLAVAAISGQPIHTGWGPVLFFGFYVVVYVVLAHIQELQRRGLPDFDELEAETRRHAVEENLRDRVTAAVHDTLLNDLALVINSPDQLDPRVAQRLRDDLDTLRGAVWLRTSSQVVAVVEGDAELRNQMMMLLSEMQWRGLTVRVTGSGTTVRHLTEDAARALVDATRACLENVLKHSGETVAGIDLSYSPTEVTVIIADEGAGFDADSIPADRLGLRHSVVERIRAVGGSVKVWSSPGAGTSIVLRVPVVVVEGMTDGPQ
jgi:signal transduction histidine kinase